ncbi:MAG: hypothetical protein V4671_31210 [Armatimonadota bacterium]
MPEESQGLVRVTLFGGITASCGTGSVSFPRRHAALLLAFLATYPDTAHSREALADRFWYKGRDKQIRSLDVTFSALCDALKPNDAFLFFRGPGTIGLYSKAVLTDTARFEGLLLDRQNGDREKTLQTALALYKGPFCGDFFDTYGANDLAEQGMWITQNRLRFGLLHAQALAEMTQIQVARGDWRAAFAYALKIPDPHLLPDRERAAVHALLLGANVPPDVLYFTLPEAPYTEDGLEEGEDWEEPERRMQAVLGFLSRLEGMGSEVTVTEREAVRGVLEAQMSRLPPDARVLLPLLSVFAGGCTSQSVCQVCRCDSLEEAKCRLEMLTERHLLGREPGEEGEPRYRLQKTIAALLEERLSLDERENLMRRLYKWLLHEYRDFNRRDAGEQAKQLGKMLAEQENTLRLLHIYLAADVSPSLWKHGLALLLATRDCWFESGKLWEHFPRYCQAETLPLRLSPRNRLRLSLQQLNAAMINHAGQPWALENANRIIEEAEQIGKQPLVGQVFSLLAISAHYRGEGTLARQMFPLALRIFPQDPTLLHTYAEVLSVQGETEESRRHFERALHSPNLTSEDDARVRCLYAGLRVFLGEYEEAESLLDDALHYYHREGNDCLLERTYREMGQLYLVRGRFGQAHAAFCQSQALCQKLGDRHSGSAAQGGVALVALRQGDLDTSRHLFTAARTVWEEPAHRHWLAVFSLHLAETACYGGDLREAESHLQEADRLLNETAAKTKKIEARYLWGLIHFANGAVREAVEAYKGALDSAFQHGGRYQVLNAAEGLAMATIAAGQFTDGAWLLGATAAERTRRAMPLAPLARPAQEKALLALRRAGAQHDYEAGTRLTLEQARDHVDRR